jgi:hypothetical protein
LCVAEIDTAKQYIDASIYKISENNRLKASGSWQWKYKLKTGA